MRASLLRGLLAGLVLVAAPHVQAQDSTEVDLSELAIGEAIPRPDMAVSTAAGSTSALADATGAAGLVVIFWSNTCPWGDRYAARIADLAATYGPAGFGIVLVNAKGRSGVAADGAEASRAELAENNLPVPYFLDPDGALTDAFGARNAPHAFLFGPSRTLLYHGAIDDSPSSADRAERRYLREAMDLSIAGLPVEVQRTQAFGCRTRTSAP